MEDWQERVKEEAAELAGRIERLDAFMKTSVYDGLDGEEQDRLDRQLEHMEAYHEILTERMDAWESDESSTDPEE